MRDRFSEAFYHSPEWKKCRAEYVKSVGGLCEDCLERGMIVPGRVVHHVRKLTPENIGDPEVTLSFGNLRLVCQDCHAKEHHPDDGRCGFDEDGKMVPRE